MTVTMLVPVKGKFKKRVQVPCKLADIKSPSWDPNQVYVELMRRCWIVPKGGKVLVFDSTVTP